MQSRYWGRFGITSPGLLILWPRLPGRLKKIPAPLAAVVVAGIAADGFSLPIAYVKVPDNLLGKEARVRSVYGDTYHLLTNTLIPQNSEKKIKIDEFALAQLTAGKWELVD